MPKPQPTGPMRLAAICGLMLSAALALAPGRAQAGDTLERLRRDGVLTLGHREAAVPFAYVHAGQPIGYAIELCEHIAQGLARHVGRARLELRHVPVTPADRVDKVASGEVDLECGSTTNTAARRARVAFTVPHFITGARYLVRRDSGIRGLEQLEGRTAVSIRRTAPLQALKTANQERLLRIRIVETDDLDEAFAMVERGQADAFVMDDILLHGQIARNAQPERLDVVGKFLTIDPLAIMLPRNDRELHAVVDEQMRQLIRSGVAQRLYERWFMQPIPPSGRRLNVPMSYLLKDFWKYPTSQVPF